MTSVIYNLRELESNQRLRVQSAFLLHDLVTQVNQHLGDVDLYWANLIAGSAQRRGIRQRLRMMQLLQL